MTNKVIKLFGLGVFALGLVFAFTIGVNVSHAISPFAGPSFQMHFPEFGPGPAGPPPELCTYGEDCGEPEGPPDALCTEGNDGIPDCGEPEGPPPPELCTHGGDGILDCGEGLDGPPVQEDPQLPPPTLCTHVEDCGEGPPVVLDPLPLPPLDEIISMGGFDFQLISIF